MPFVSNMPDDEQQQNPSQGAVPPSGGAPVKLSPSSGVLGAGTPTGIPGGGTTAAPAGGQFASLNQYLNANQGQAQPLANKINAGINQQYNTLNSQGTSALNNINQQVSSSAPTSQDQTNSIISQESANPASFTNNPSNVASFQGLLNASYGGPASAESTSDYTNQQNAINTAIAQGQTQTATEAGREGLISGVENTPGTSTTALNSAILSQDPNALASVQNAYQPFNNLLTNLQTGVGTIDQQIAQNQAQAAADQQASQQAISSQINALNTGVTGELNTAQQNAIAQDQAIQSAINNLYGGQALNTAATTLGTYGGGSTPWVNTTNYTVNPFSTAADTALGMTPDQAAALQGALQQAATSQFEAGHNFGAGSGTTQIDLSQFLNLQNPYTAITAGNVATPQDYAQAQAFQTLLNGLNVQAPQTIIDPTQAALAGTAPTNLAQFDYNAALQNAQQTATTERQNAQAEAAALTGAADLAHAQSQHGGGVLGAVTNAVTHPLSLAAVLSNPMAWASNATRVVNGQTISPTDFSLPYAKAVAPVVGGIIGGIYGNAPGAVGGAAAGQALGGTLQNIGNQPGKAYAHGGTVEPKGDFKSLLDKLSKRVK